MIFSVGGQSIFPNEQLLACLCYMSTSVASILAKAMLGRIDIDPQFEIGVIKRLPYPSMGNLHESLSKTSVAAIRAIAWVLSLDETTNLFIRPWVDCLSQSLAEIVQGNSEFCDQQQEVVQSSHDKSEKEIFNLFRLSEAAQRFVSDGFSLDREDFRVAKRQDETARRVVSYLVGCVLGRWNLAIALHDDLNNLVKDPFLPLTAQSPGEIDCAALEGATGNFNINKICVAADGILVDDPDHSGYFYTDYDRSLS